MRGNPDKVIGAVHGVWALEDRARAGDREAVLRLIEHGQALRTAAWGLLEQRKRRGARVVTEEALEDFERALIEACASAAAEGKVGA